MIMNDFIYEVTDRVRHMFGDTCEVLIKKVPYNNGQHLTGIVFKKDEEASSLIYLEKYYDQYVSGNMSMVEIVDELVRLQEENGIQEMMGAGSLTDYETVRARIRLKLVNYEANKARLERMPYIPYLDTAIVFYIELDSNGQRRLTAAVEQHHMEIWGVGKERIYEEALCNMRACCPVEVKSSMSVIKNFDEDLSLSQKDIFQEYGFWIMTTKTGLQGASTLVYGNGLKQFARLYGDDIVILPSSIHEVILLPQGLVGGNYEYFSRMVEEVNKTEVLVEDRLSNSVYLYSRENDSVTIAYKGPGL